MKRALLAAAFALRAALFALGAAPAWSAADDAVHVTALRHPVDKSYRQMMKGRALFDELHGMAPAASLRYRLIPRKSGTDMHELEVLLVGKTFERPVAVAADRTFALQPDRQALDENARVRSERKAETLTWRVDIRTPGLPPDTRRLGDLRLECLVGVQAGLISRYPSFVERFLDLFRTPEGFCNRDDAPYLFFSARPLFGVTLVSGERREDVATGRLYAGTTLGLMPQDVLPYCDCEAMLDRAYTLPLGDRSWPDDTRVELHYMDDAAASAVPGFVGATKAQARAAFGEAKVVRFANGFEVWAYDWGPPQRPPLERDEFVLLFDRSGVATKVRQR